MGKTEAVSPNMSASVQTLIQKADKYDRMYATLKEYMREPDDPHELQGLCVMAGSDDTLDEIMDLVGVDSLDELETILKAIFGDIRRLVVNPVVAEAVKKAEDNQGCMTTPAFWDCACQENYIHPRNESWCSRCGAKQEDRPDARLNEVKEMLYAKAVGEIRWLKK